MASLRSRLNLPPETIYLVDGSAFVFRAFYAMQNMARSDGFPTNILFIVTRLLLRLIREEQPAYFSFILDGKGPSHRNTLFADYKANRSATPENLIQQLAPLLEIVNHLGLPYLVSEGCEADDCIAALANKYSKTHPVVIIGADKDLRQCLRNNVVMWDPAAKSERVTTLADFIGETGFNPDLWPDYQALIGDSSDNIPGIAKVGPKTALPLIQEFGKLENLFDRLAAVPPKIRSRLEGQRENALLYRELTTLQCSVCPAIKLKDLVVNKVALAPVQELLDQYELRALVREVLSMDRIGVWRQDPLTATAKKYIPTSQNTSSGSNTKPDGLMGLPASTPATNSKSFSSATISGKGTVATKVSPKKPTSAAGAMVEGNLFTAPTDNKFVDINKFATVATIQGLPKFDAGAVVALIPVEDTFLFAVGTSEVVFTGSCKDLAHHLHTQKTTIICPDVKSFCKAHPELWAVPITQWFDFSIAAYLLNPEERTYAWEHLYIRYGDIAGSEYSFDTHPGLLAFDIYTTLMNQLQGAELIEVYTTIEIPLIPVLAAMEHRGIPIDKSAFFSFLQEVQGKLDILTLNIHKAAGGPFNIRSSQQLGDVLFNYLHLPKAGKTKGGALSTSQAALEKLTGKHPIIDDILQYRQLEKLRSTYLEPLPLAADEHDRVHTTFNQTATATGRLSSSNPNLQNIPIRGPMGERMRSCFIASAGNFLVCADYSQIELRVLAHLSKDPTLLEAFKNNQDIHKSTAALLYDVQGDAVTAEQRRNAKTINFGLIYGMGALKLGQELGISMKEAKVFIERYFEKLNKLKQFYDTIEKEAAANGYVATMTGRRRLTPDITSANNQMRSQARRQAINTRIQGSAADIIKLAMIAVENDFILKDLGAKLLLQIHDELVLEVATEKAPAAGERLVELMSTVAPSGHILSIPMLVDCTIAPSWGQE